MSTSEDAPLEPEGAPRVPKVTRLGPGMFHIDRLGPGESVELELNPASADKPVWDGPKSASVEWSAEDTPEVLKMRHEIGRTADRVLQRICPVCGHALGARGRHLDGTSACPVVVAGEPWHYRERGVRGWGTWILLGALGLLIAGLFVYVWLHWPESRY